MAKLCTQSTFPSTLTIDGVTIDVRITRLTNTEFDAFADGFARWSEPRGPEETPEARKAREQASAAWLRQVLDEHVAIVAGEFEHDGQAITKGGDLIDIYGGRLDVVPQAVALIWGENRVSEPQKKTYRSHLASRFGSIPAPPSTANGNAADSIAARVDVPASIETVGAMAPPSDGSSGTTDLSV